MSNQADVNLLPPSGEDTAWAADSVVAHARRPVVVGAPCITVAVAVVVAAAVVADKRSYQSRETDHEAED